MEHRCGYLISQIKTISDRLLDRILEEHEIQAFSGAQGRVLDILWQKDNIPIRDIAKETGLSMPTLTGLLDRMEKAGLIRRMPDPADRRKVNIVLAEKTRELEKDYRDVSEAMNSIFMQGFSDQEITELQAYLERILENLQKKENDQ